MKRFKFILLTVLFMALVLTGCAECISTETSTVNVKVIEQYHKDDDILYCYNVLLKRTMVLHDTAINKITVEYDGVQYSFDDQATYNKYFDKVGKCVKGTLETRKYDDGTIKQRIISLD